MSRIYRFWEGRKWEPALTDGCYILGDPRAGGKKHHADNQVTVRDEQGAIDLIQRGYSIRVKTSTSPSLVRKNLYIDGIKAT